MMKSRKEHKEIMFLCVLPLKGLVWRILNVEVVLFTKVLMFFLKTNEPFGLLEK